ncbi:MAG: DUF4136 domain-containing protein [Betaproteobacteria bacterium]
MKARFYCLLLLTLALAGCSGMRIIDSEVHAYTVPPGVSVPATYRFEQLLSQQARPTQRNQLEDMVQTELDKVGMRRDDTAAQYSVSFELRVHRDPRSPWDDPGYGAGFFRGFPIVTRHGVVYPYPGPYFVAEMPWYRREVSLLMRRLSDGGLVFETHASSDGYWADDAAVIPAMFEAALRDFPNPPPGPRQVNIEIPR